MARIQEYWLQIENQAWDVTPRGADRLTGAMLARGASGAFRPLAEEALVIRRYTANWAQPADQRLNPWDLSEPDPAQSRGTIPGPVLTAKVADEIVVHFRNMDRRAHASPEQRTHSLHAHGMEYDRAHSGLYPLAPPDPAQDNRHGDRVPPEESFVYRWRCPHRSTAGAWLYHDGAAAGQQSMALGAFGVLVIQAAGEQSPAVPIAALRRPSDTVTHFAAVPPPPKQADYVLVFHRPPGLGLCLNGRQGLGNTPTLVAGDGTRLLLRCLNAAEAPVTFCLHGLRWEAQGRWTDTETLPPGAGVTLSLLPGSREHGGGAGEWLFTGRIAGDDMVAGSLIVTEGGAVTLLSA